MSKQLKKFRKNDFSYDDVEIYDNRSTYLERKNKRRTDRALRTMDISALVAEDGLDPEDIEDEIWDNEVYNYRENKKDL
jgi:hypothetical protein